MTEKDQMNIRKKLDSILEMLRLEAWTEGNDEKITATEIAITQLEIASMCIIRSFFADKPYSPLQLLKPKKEGDK